MLPRAPNTHIDDIRIKGYLLVALQARQVPHIPHTTSLLLLTHTSPFHPPRCLSGCECPPTRFNGHSQTRKSVLLLHKLFATQHPECILSVEVLEDSDSGEHKVKLTGAIVSDQAGDQDGIDNAGAVEHVHDIIFRNHAMNGSVFDIRNHVRR